MRWAHGGRCTRLVALLAFVVGTAAAFGQSALAQAKDDLMPRRGQTFDAGIGPMQLLQLLIALAVVVIILKVVLPRLAPRIQRRIAHQSGDSVRVTESIELGGAGLHLVRVRDRELLIGTATSGVQLIADVTPASSSPPPPTFLDFVDSAMTNAEYVQRSMDREAYDRLGTLIK
jgi:flagellar biogenesis protein FliO